MTPSVPQSELGILLILWRALGDDLRTFSILAEEFVTSETAVSRRTFDRLDLG
jgi:hypothetical protein